MPGIETATGLAKVRALVESGAARSIRLGAGLSLAETAAACGVSVSTMFRWEARERRPHGEPALRYLELLERLMGAR
jgi:DNA-binding transcriptional regulator YiaG